MKPVHDTTAMTPRVENLPNEVLERHFGSQLLEHAAEHSGLEWGAAVVRPAEAEAHTVAGASLENA